MLTIYTDEYCEKVARAIAEATGSNSQVTLNADELQGDYIVTCISKKPLGGEANAIENKIHEKIIWLVGVGFSFQQMHELAKKLEKQGATIQNTLCLKRKNFFPLGGEVGEIELARAKAFGERILTRITGTKIRQKNEKNRIKNYQHAFKQEIRSQE